MQGLHHRDRIVDMQEKRGGGGNCPDTHEGNGGGDTGAQHDVEPHGQHGDVSLASSKPHGPPAQAQHGQHQRECDRGDEADG